MGFAWKFMLPLVLLNLVVAGVWRFMGDGITRWIVCSAMLVIPYLCLGNGLNAARGVGRRTYRYAE
jgi:NADH-quinone oxidoreductase subunit H